MQAIYDCGNNGFDERYELPEGHMEDRFSNEWIRQSIYNCSGKVAIQRMTEMRDTLKAEAAEWCNLAARHAREIERLEQRIERLTKEYAALELGAIAMAQKINRGDHGRQS